jgi:predicted DNA-binding transcriptional regulator AlpA
MIDETHPGRYEGKRNDYKALSTYWARCAHYYEAILEAAPNVVDINGAAEILGVSRQTAYSMKAAGKLPPCTEVRGGSIWWREAIEAVAKERAT